MALGTWFGDGLGSAGLDDLEGPFQMKHSYDSMFGADIMLSNHWFCEPLGYLSKNANILDQSVS